VFDVGLFGGIIIVVLCTVMSFLVGFALAGMPSASA
jgi:hypothetical protein